MLGLCAVAGDWKLSDLFSNSLGRAEGTVVSLCPLDNQGDDLKKKKIPKPFHRKAWKDFVSPSAMQAAKKSTHQRR